MTALTVDLKPFVATEEEFRELSTKNPELRFERLATGEVTIMPPTGGATGARNASISGQLWQWNDRVRGGEAFDSSTGFRLPNGAQLGWLIDPQNRQVEVYHPGQAVEILKNSAVLSGEPTLPQFELNLGRIFR